MLKFTLSAHAQTVIAERSIDPEWIGRVLAKPERIANDESDPVLRHAIGRIPEYGNRALRVIYNDSAEPVRVVRLTSTER